MKLGCLRARKHLWVYLEGRPVEPWLAEHVRHCGACASEAARLRREADRLQAAADRPALPDADALWARIEARIPRRRRAPWLLPARLAPVALLIAVWAARPFGVPVETPVVEPVGPAKGVAGIDKHGSASKSAPTVAPDTRRVALAATKDATPLRQRRPSVSPTRVRPEGGSVAPAARVPRPSVPTPPAEAPAAAREEPVTALVVVHAPEGEPIGTAYGGTPMACRSESTDPVSGEVTRQAVSWETDAAGTTHLTIEYEVQRAGASGAISEPKT